MSYPIWYITKKLQLSAPKGIIHVGANEGQESEAYNSIEPEAVLWVEPIPAIFEKLNGVVSEFENNFTVQTCCSDTDGEEVTFNIANQSGASSMLPLSKHAELYPATKFVDSFQIKTEKLDSILESQFPSLKFNLLVLDTQGSELKVLQGSHRTLKKLDFVYAEVSEEPLYEGGCTYEQLANLLSLYGFKPKSLKINHNNWGDALFGKS